MDAKTVNRLLFTAAALLGATLPAHSYADGADVSCEAEDSRRNCTLELDEISPADLSVEVMSLDLYRLSKTRSNAKGEFTFIAPKQKYFLLIDAGPGHVFDVGPEHFAAN
ncbi:hypothetical protein [Aliamphritea hakodatensis]|uniref:hypothetical protein n=1 Tax=Aliamphritea hakodatensis TaxID=2895352 RepID=UPI0022FDAD24|nr:hypothetical protein [Aliamphritea hakodatensis]